MLHSGPSGALVVAVLALTACGGGATTPAIRPAEPVSLPVAGETPGALAIATKSNCTEPTNFAAAAEREKGIDAFLADRPSEALELLTSAVKTDPRDRAAEAFRMASTAKLEESRARATDANGSLTRVSLEPIPLAQATRRSVDGAPAAKVHLEKQSEAKNLITDNADWEAKHQVPSNAHRGGAEHSTVAPKLGNERLQKTITHADHVVAIYQSTIVVSGAGKRSLAFDVRTAMTRAPRPFEVVFAQVVGKALVVQLAYNGYAKDSGGKNGYFAAYEAASGALLWVSEPLVANSDESLIAGGSIVTGYGFTAEPDFLFVLDLATGMVDQKIPLKSGPDAIRPKGDRLFVRTYDTDYVFKSTTGLPPALPASLIAEASETALPPPDAETRCWVRRATASIAAKDAEGIREAAARLKPLSRDRVLDELLAIEAKKLSMPGRLDLTAAPLIVVPAPPWQATPPAPGGTKTAPKLVKVSSNTASPVRNMNPTFDPTQPFFLAPVKQGKLPEGARADIPSSFGQEHLSAIIPDQAPSSRERAILLYGGRFLALLAGDKAERIFDLDSFRHPPKANPQWKEFAIEDATYAQERDNVLYICNGGGSYAKEVFGKKGFLSAIDATTGKLLWRSAPLTCNATFAVAGDHLISGYGFTAEPDFVFVVRRSDGGIVQKVPIDSGPESITLTGTRVHVETYSSQIDFDLR